MCILQVQVQCVDRFFEVIPDEVENAELAVEDVVCQVLLDLFDGGTVDDVAICFLSRSPMDLQQCSIQISAQGSCQCFVAHSCTKKLAVEQRMRSLLKELFGSVYIASVTLDPAL